MSVEEAIKNLNIMLDSARRRTRRNIVIPDLIEAIEMAIEALETHDELCENLAWYINERKRLLKAIEYSNPNEGLQRTIKRALERPHGECNQCKNYEGVHGVQGHAPCSFWGIGGVLSSDYCSRFEKEGEAE